MINVSIWRESLLGLAETTGPMGTGGRRKSKLEGMRQVAGRQDGWEAVPWTSAVFWASC